MTAECALINGIGDLHLATERKIWMSWPSLQYTRASEQRLAIYTELLRDWRSRLSSRLDSVWFFLSESLGLILLVHNTKPPRAFEDRWRRPIFAQSNRSACGSLIEMLPFGMRFWWFLLPGRPDGGWADDQRCAHIELLGCCIYSPAARCTPTHCWALHSLYLCIVR